MSKFPRICDCGRFAFVDLTGPWVATIDANDISIIDRGAWAASNQKNAKIVYAKRTESGRCIYMHRLIASARSRQSVDHVDRNGLNNSSGNLRIATRAQNNMNASPRRGCSSRFKGVYWSRAAKKWSAYITFEKERHHLGLFADENMAALAYNGAAIKMFGEFACVNNV